MRDSKNLRVLMLITALSASFLLISNIVAVKLWDFFGIAVDGGIIVFPLTYILCDLAVELYGKKIANYIIYIGFFINIIAVLTFLIVGGLPEFPGWGKQDSYEAILGFMPRVAAGSLLAYLLSGLVNNWSFIKIKQHTGESKLWMRLLGSSAIAKIVDCLVFEMVAFFGVLELTDFAKQAAFSYIAGLTLEALLTPITYLIIKRLKKYGISDQKILTK